MLPVKDGHSQRGQSHRVVPRLCLDLGGWVGVRCSPQALHQTVSIIGLGYKFLFTSTYMFSQREHPVLQKSLKISSRHLEVKAPCVSEPLEHPL